MIPFLRTVLLRYLSLDISFTEHCLVTEALKAVYKTEKFGSGPLKKAERTHNFCKETLEFLQKLWVRSAFLRGPDPNFSVV